MLITTEDHCRTLNFGPPPCGSYGDTYIGRPEISCRSIFSASATGNCQRGHRLKEYLTIEVIEYLTIEVI